MAETRADTATGHERVTVERRSVDWIVCVAGLGVFLICALIVHKGTASPLEQRVFRWINGLPDLLSSPMKLAQFLGVLAVGPIVAVGAAVFRRWRLALAAIIVSTGLAWVLTPYLRGRWRILPWGVVALVSFVRIYLGAHAPLDVIGGVGLGLIVGGAANLIVGVERKGTGSYEGAKVS